MFPSAKILGYLYQFLQISNWFRNFQTIAVTIRKQSAGVNRTQRLYRFNHGLKFWECPIHSPITQACLMSEHITCCLKRFSDISVTVFALSVQPDYLSGLCKTRSYSGLSRVYTSAAPIKDFKHFIKL